MATQIQDIRTPNWQISPSELGAVITDEQDILQCLNNIIFTRRGDVPFNPRFGTDIYKSVDGPQNKIAPMIVSEIIQSVDSFEKRVKVNSVSATGGADGNIVFTLHLTVIASASEIKFSFNLSQLKSV